MVPTLSRRRDIRDAARLFDTRLAAAIEPQARPRMRIEALGRTLHRARNAADFRTSISPDWSIATP
jgi:hypothetical protein